jgi:hypothetical protein
VLIQETVDRASKFWEKWENWEKNKKAEGKTLLLLGCLAAAD